MKNYKTLADSELCTFLNQADKKAYTEIYIRYFPKLFLHALDRLKSEDDAKDLVQTIFTYIWINHSAVTPTNLKAYLYASTKNAVINFINRQKKGTAYLDTLHPYLQEGECITDHLVRENMLSDIIEAEINRLPPKMRQVFLLRRKEFLSIKEIALQLEISEETVKTQIKNAIRILRVRLTLLAYIFYLMHK
jgi:RNA polymerase sigma-70 factor (family 1)